jgi:DNA-binding CsgD family transcriptional regulator
MDPVNESVLAIYRLAQDCALDQYHERALALLAPFSPFDAARWGSGSIAPSGLSVTHTYLHNAPPEMVAAYDAVKSHDQQATARANRSGFHTLRLHASTHCSLPEQRVLRDYQRRFRQENSLVVAHIRARDWQTNFISLYREREEAQFSVDEARIVEELWPHLLEGRRVNLRIQASDLVMLGGRAGSGLGIVDGSGAILYAEREAILLLDEHGPCLRKGYLPSAIFESLRSAGKYRNDVIRICSAVVQEMIFFRVRRLRPADSLSPRELEIARAMARGATHKTVALELGISPETVRSHLRRIHEKLSVKNRAGLIAELAEIE